MIQHTIPPHIVENLFTPYSDNAFETAIGANLERFTQHLISENIDLTLTDGHSTHDLISYFERAKEGDLFCYRLLAYLCHRYSSSYLLRKLALETLHVLSRSLSGQWNPHAQYDYALCLLKDNKTKEALKIIEWLSSCKYPPAQCRWGVYKMLGSHGIKQELKIARSLFEQAAKTGHVKSRLFTTRIKRKHGNFWEKIAWPLDMPKHIFYIIKLGSHPEDPTHWVY